VAFASLTGEGRRRRSTEGLAAAAHGGEERAEARHNSARRSATGDSGLRACTALASDLAVGGGWCQALPPADTMYPTLPSILWQAFCGTNIAGSLQVSDAVEVFELMLQWDTTSALLCF